MTPYPPTTPRPLGADSGQGGANADSPSEIALETLRQLALRKIPPTPENYRELYCRIRGSADDDVFPTRALKAIANALPRATPAETRSAQVVEAAIASGKWPELQRAITDLHTSRSRSDKAWGALIRDLILQFERRHAELTQARKREALNHVLSAHPSADILHERLGSLVHSWSQINASDAPACSNPLPPDDVPETPGCGAIPLADGGESLAGEAHAPSDALLDVDGPPLREAITVHLEQPAARTARIGEESRAEREALIGLLRLLVDNIRGLVIDDNWLHEQMSIISAAFSGPITLRTLDDLARQLREVIDRQSRLKDDFAKAQDRLKEMLAGFIDRLSEVIVHASGYHDLLERSARRISEAGSIADLSEVVGELLDGTRGAQESTLRASRELTELRKRADEATNEIARLHDELNAASHLIRHDPLTGALNRRGLSEAFTREISRMNRKDTPLCIALIDIDNFKEFNDAHGHGTGDEALRHLARTITEALRPQDMVARYGGEEFIILLPDTAPEAANTILIRLQRELTRRIFCAPGSERLLITFSAGIARILPGEQPEASIARADKAMYAAKRAGKNRVLLAV
ncbi:MAG: diguanylate cyclase [Azoarcus sp.]|jgi:diguanylate cyclase|nr:diguanylate cyclase [Azoarcus sp.]